MTFLEGRKILLRVGGITRSLHVNDNLQLGVVIRGQLKGRSLIHILYLPCIFGNQSNHQ